MIAEWYEQRVPCEIQDHEWVGPLNLLIDSAEIKAEGEGEWNARKHGGPKRRIWRTIHIGIDEEILEVRAVEVTIGNTGDAPMLPKVLDQTPPEQHVGPVTADIAYDTRKCCRTWCSCRHAAPQKC